MNESVDRLVEAHRRALGSFLRKNAGPALLRFDTVDDLVQGTIVEALRGAQGFDFRTEEEARAWLFTLARRHLMRRREYWFALKRGSRALVKLTLNGSLGSNTDLALPYKGSGPVTRSDRRDLMLRVTRAMAMLLPRDRELLRWAAEGATPSEIATRLELSEASVGKARERALNRLRKAYRLLEQTEG